MLQRSFYLESGKETCIWIRVNSSITLLYVFCTRLNKSFSYFFESLISINNDFSRKNILLNPEKTNFI